MNNHRAALNGIMEMIGSRISKPLRIQIARRILAQYFEQVLYARKQNQSLNSLEGELFSINFNTAKFTGSFRLTIKCYLELFYLFLNYSFILLCRNPNLSVAQMERTNLFFGHNFPSGNIQDIETSAYFMQFAQENNHPSAFFLERVAFFKKPKLVESCIFSFSPTLSLLLLTNSFFFRLRLASRLVSEFVFYFFVSPFLGSRQLVIRDLFFQGWMARRLMERKSELNLFCSPNSLFVQNLLFNLDIPHFSRSMIWYSASAMKRQFEDEWYIDETVYFDLPIDVHYVWTKEHANFLNRSKKCRTVVVGPQLFYLPPIQPTRVSVGSKIAIMDVTPTNWSIYQDTLYSEVRGVWFLDQIYEALSGTTTMNQRPRIEFKYKRPVGSIHSSKYVHKVEELQSQGFLNIVDPEINLFDYISGLSCLITTQLTSVGLIAEDLGIKVIYLDPFVSSRISDSYVARNALELKEVLLANGIIDS